MQSKTDMTHHGKLHYIIADFPKNMHLIEKCQKGKFNKFQSWFSAIELETSVLNN